MAAFEPCPNWTVFFKADVNGLTNGNTSIGTRLNAQDIVVLGEDTGFPSTTIGAGEVDIIDLAATPAVPDGHYKTDYRSSLGANAGGLVRFRKQ